MRMLGMVCIARYPYNLFADDLEELAKTEPVAVNKAEALRLAQDLREGGKKSQF